MGNTKHTPPFDRQVFTRRITNLVVDSQEHVIALCDDGTAWVTPRINVTGKTLWKQVDTPSD